MVKISGLITFERGINDLVFVNPEQKAVSEAFFYIFLLAQISNRVPDLLTNVFNNEIILLIGLARVQPYTKISE
jgi:hypothetical protein